MVPDVNLFSEIQNSGETRYVYVNYSWRIIKQRHSISLLLYFDTWFSLNWSNGIGVSLSPFMSVDGSSTVSRELWKTMLIVLSTNTRRIRAPILRRDQQTHRGSDITPTPIQVVSINSEICGNRHSTLLSLNLRHYACFHVTRIYGHMHTVTCAHTHE